MNFILIFIFSVITFGNFAFSDTSFNVRKRDDGFRSLKPFSTCDSNYFECSSSGGCCPIGSTCAAGGCCSPGTYECEDSDGGCCKFGSSCLPNYRCSSGGGGRRHRRGSSSSSSSSSGGGVSTSCSDGVCTSSNSTSSNGGNSTSCSNGVCTTSSGNGGCSVSGNGTCSSGPQPKDDNESAMIGTIVGSISGALLIVGVFFLYRRHRQTHKKPNRNENYDSRKDKSTNHKPPHTVETETYNHGCETIPTNNEITKQEI